MVEKQHDVDYSDPDAQAQKQVSVYTLILYANYLTLTILIVQ